MKVITETTVRVYTVDIDGKPVDFRETSEWKGLVHMQNDDGLQIIAIRENQAFGLGTAFGIPSQLTPIMASAQLLDAIGLTGKSDKN